MLIFAKFMGIFGFLVYIYILLLIFEIVQMDSFNF